MRFITKPRSKVWKCVNETERNKKSKCQFCGTQLQLNAIPPYERCAAIREFGIHVKLSTIAMKMLSVPPANAAVELSFSVQGRIYSIDLDRLSNEKVQS